MTLSVQNIDSESTVRPRPLTTQIHFFQSELRWMFLEFWNEAVAESNSENTLAIKRFSFGYHSRQEALAKFTDEKKPSPWVQPQVVRDNQLPEQAKSWKELLLQFATGIPTDLSTLPIDKAHLTEFGQQVSQACREIVWGQTRSYGQLAVLVGSPNASRAVGGVMARNRFPLIVPCHRVMASNGSLCGFSAADGLEMKKRLLQNESSTLFKI